MNDAEKRALESLRHDAEPYFWFVDETGTTEEMLNALVGLGFAETRVHYSGRTQYNLTTKGRAALDAARKEGL